MKRVLVIGGVMAALATSAPASAQTELGIDASLYSSYVWRGLTLTSGPVLQPDVYRPLLVEGLQQARDTRLPQVAVHRQLKVFLEDELEVQTDEVRAYGDPNAGPSIHAAVRARNAHRVLLAVGPEGGWTDYERALLARHGFEAVTMGPRTLRSDTACVSLLALAHDALRSRNS